MPVLLTTRALWSKYLESGLLSVPQDKHFLTFHFFVIISFDKSSTTSRNVCPTLLEKCKMDRHYSVMLVNCVDRNLTLNEAYLCL
jgi:hypothetical protein